MSSFEEFQRVNTRQASVLHVGGFRPTNDPLASNFGLKPLGAPGEIWPVFQNKPMLFVCQMNLAAAPFVPPQLDGIQLITFFAQPSLNSLKKENGMNWCLKTYTSLDGLTPLAAPANAPALKRGFECRWEECVDHPHYDDPELAVPEGFDASEAQLDNVDKTKLGGYASSIQSEPWWAHTAHPSDPRYSLQIASEEKAGVVWGDGGIVYIARGAAEGCADQWFLDCQCY